jgi:hypothetical protein
MSDRYLKFSFENAKLFPKNEKTKDFVTNVDVTKKGKLVLSRSSRAERKNGNFKEPITMFQISNMLHTLVGERPKSSFRESFYSMDNNILELAKNSFLKISSPKTTKIVKGEEIETFYKEFTKVNKSANNSWSKYKNIEWFKVKKLLGEYFEEFINMINEALGYNVLDKPFENLLNAYSVYGSKLDETINFLVSNKKKPIVNFLKKENPDRSEITKSTALLETLTAGIDSAYFLDGEILVPYDEKFVNRMIKNSTNILDGGYVKLDGVFYEDELYGLDAFNLVSEISIEKY